MIDPEAPVSRRTTLKGIAIGGMGLLAGGAQQAGAQAAQTSTLDTVPMSNDAWFAERAWSVSANKVLAPQSGPGGSVTCLAKSIHRPKSAADVSAIVRATPTSTPIACVCGGHESSNAALVADRGAVVLDLIGMKSIEFHRSGDDRLVTVGSGVVFRELVEAIREHGGALPVGTGPGVGVAGYVPNGGLSSYFSRRLGLLGQRAVKMTVVTADGEIRTLTPADDLFNAMLGAGSALAVVVDITFRLADASVVKGAEQRVFGFDSREQAVRFARESMRFMRERVLPNDSVSLEVVVTGTKAVVATTVFYDTFGGDAAAFVKPLEDLAASMGLPELARGHWGSWYEAAAALWPVIAGQKGSPLATLYHCTGTTSAPDDRAIDFVSDTIVGRAPLDEAPLSIVEIRSLGGAAQSGPAVPSGNCRHAFFVDLVTLYDAKSKDADERRAIVDRTNAIVDAARQVPGLGVDFSGTHSQPDDPDRSAVAADIFGTAEMAAKVRAVKLGVDPANRFRFHPFAKFIAGPSASMRTE